MSSAACSRAAAMVALCLLLFSASAWCRERTDVVTLKNGDRLTGEIIGLEYGKLQLKTDSLGTVSVNWPDIASVRSGFRFRIEALDGRQYFGALGEDGGQLQVTSGDAGTVLPLSEVVRLGPVEERFLERLSGSTSVGVNYTNSSSIKVGSFRFDARYRGESTLGSLGVSADITSSPASGTAQRIRVDYAERYLFPQTRFIALTGTFERIDELGIDGRVQAGVTAGRSLWHRPDSNLDAFAGIAANEEWARGTEASTFTVEGVFGLDWRIYRFSEPEVTLHAELIAYPSLTEPGRVRARLDTSLVHKFENDFTLSFSVYDDYDNQPPGTRSVTNDLGVVTSLGYSF